MPDRYSIRPLRHHGIGFGALGYPPRLFGKSLTVVLQVSNFSLEFFFEVRPQTLACIGHY